MTIDFKKLTFLFPVEGFKATLRRFPLSSLCAVVLFIISLLTIHDVIYENEEGILRISLALVFGYFWFGIVQLVSESRNLNERVKAGIGIGFFAALAVYLMFADNVLFMAFVMPAMLLSVSVAPYLTSRDNLSLWFFNQQTWFGVAVAMLAGMIWGGGISAALGSIDYLFDVDMPEEVYGDIWAFSAIIFSPLYALSWIPEKFHYREEDCTSPEQLSFLLNWVMAPLLMIYGLILYAYFVKIIIVQEIPRGQLSYMISGFGLVGIATYLAGWPIREVGAMPVRLFFRIFFAALIVPTVFLFIAINERIGQYGVTEQRYAIVMVAIFFAINAAVFTYGKIVRREMPMKIISISLAILLLIASAGPWGATSVSGRSQFKRLEELLVKYERLENGKLVKKETEIPFADRQSISSIFDYMYSTKRQELVMPWISKEENARFASTSWEITKLIGFDHVSQYEQELAPNKFNFYSNNNVGIIDTRGYDYMLDGQWQYHCRSVEPNTSCEKHSWIWLAKLDTGMPTIKAKIVENLLIVEPDGYAPISFDLNQVIELAKRNQKKETIVLESLDGQKRGLLYLERADGELVDGKPVFNNLNFHVMVRLEQ